MLFKNKDEVKLYIEKNGVQSPVELCEQLVKEQLKNSPTSIVSRILKFLDTSKEYPYFNLYVENFLIPRMLTRYYRDITKADVDKALILQKGRDFPDGFSGIQVKAVSYTSNYVVQVSDGERGILFVKKYNHFPTYDELLMDTLLESTVHTPMDYFPFSIADLFSA